MKKQSFMFAAVALVAILLVCPGCSNIQTNSADSKEKDLDFLSNTLETKHKNLYANMTKEEFEIKKNKIVSNISNLSDSDYYYSLKHLLSLVGDAHTNVGYNESQYKHLNALGFAIVKFSTGWHLMMLEEQNQHYLGYELLAINDMSIEDVFKRAKTIMSFDNEVWAEQQFSNTINFREALEYLEVIDQGESIMLSIQKDDNSPIEQFEVKSMTEEEVMNAKIVQLTMNEVPATAPQDIYRAMALDEHTYFIQYNSCEESQTLPMKEFIQIVSDEINTNPYKKIVIDMRYNSGGNSAIFEPMIKTLQELQATNDFEVYTLIGENTFSSAIINSIQMKELLDCTLVGTQTGGSVNHYGELKSFNLNNSPITVWYSTNYFELVTGYEKDSLYPDIEIEKTLENYLNGVDSEIALVLSIP
ncbi:MAG: hypothetical protein ACRCST_11815 [Turicibacter sp.]